MIYAHSHHTSCLYSVCAHMTPLLTRRRAWTTRLLAAVVAWTMALGAMAAAADAFPRQRTGPVITTENGFLYVFARSGTGSLAYREYIRGSWSGWRDLGGQIVGEPQAVSWYNGHVAVFVRGTDDRIHRRTLVAGSWSGWEALNSPRITGDPELVAWSTSRIDVFARGADNGDLIHGFVDGSGSWGGWESLGGGIVGKPSSISWNAGHLQVFVRGTDDKLYQRWYSGGWSQWEAVGTTQITAAPEAVAWSSGRVDVFARGVNADLAHAFYANGIWQGWESLGGAIEGTPSVVSFNAGHLDVYVRGSGGVTYHRWTNNSPWSDFQSISSYNLSTGPWAVSWGSGHIDVYGQLYPTSEHVHTWWNGSAWENAPSLGQPSQGNFIVNNAHCGDKGINPSSTVGLAIPVPSRALPDGAQRYAYEGAARCLRQMQGGRPILMRTQAVRIDATRVNTGELDVFIRLVRENRDLSTAGYRPEVVISPRAATYERCTGADRETSSTPLQSCQHPTVALYATLFTELRNYVNQPGRLPDAEFDVRYSAWNEPDHSMSALHPSDNDKASELAGRFWQRAANVLNDPRRVLAGEFSDTSGDTLKLRTAKFKAGLAAEGTTTPKNWAATTWAIHPYGDFLHGSSFEDRTKTFFGQANMGGTIQYLTEVGPLLAVNGTITNLANSDAVTNGDRQAASGARALARLRSSIPTKMALYLLQPPNFFSADGFDSAIGDRNGLARPFVCGLTELPRMYCQGDAAAQPGPR